MHISGRTPSAEYLLEPTMASNNDAVRAMCCLLRPTAFGAKVRMVNAGNSEAVLHKGKVVGIARAEFEMSLQNLAKRDDPRRQVTGYKLDESLQDSKKREIREVVNRYDDVFWAEGDHLPTARTGIQHEIHFNIDTGPQWSRPCRTAPDTRKEMRDKVEYLIQQGPIRDSRESTSPWTASIVAARRKNGRLRLAMDYRRLNADSHPQHHPLPLIEDLVDQLTEAQIFSTVDLKSG